MFFSLTVTQELRVLVDFKRDGVLGNFIPEVCRKRCFPSIFALRIRVLKQFRNHDFKMLIKPKEFHCFWSIGSKSSSSAAGQPAKQHPLQKRHDFFHKVITNPSLLSQIQPGPVLSRASNLPKHEIYGSSIGV